MTQWQKVWREGLRPLLSDVQVAALRKALVEDDPRLIQGATTSPPRLSSMQDWPVEGACLVGFCGWRDGLNNVSEVEKFFGLTCYAIDNQIGEVAACRHLLNWFDETPRDEMRRELLAEIG